MGNLVIAPESDPVYSTLMPGARDPNKTLASFWMHRDISTALNLVAKANGQTVTRVILEALAARIGFSLDEKGYPVGLDLEALARDSFAPAKRAPRTKR